MFARRAGCPIRSRQAATGGHAISLAFACDDPADVDATHAALVAAGHRSHLDPFDAFWGQRFATVLDPDANTIDFFAALATADS